MQALQALALAAAGEEALAADALAGALTLAWPQGYVRVFADEGPPVAVLLGRLVAAQKAGQAAVRTVPLGCLARVLQAFGGKNDVQGAGRAIAAAVPGLVEQLTARELAPAAAGRGHTEPAHRRAAGGQPRHRGKARQPPTGQARRGQPDRGRHPGSSARPDPLATPQPIPRAAPPCPGPARRHCRAGRRAAEDSTRMRTFG
jgi:MalT-like TPR region